MNSIENVINSVKVNGCAVKENVLLSDCTTFRTGGKIGAVITPDDENAAAFALECCEENGVKYLILGNGSNLLAPDGGFDGVAIRLTGKMKNIEYLDDGFIKCQAGATLASLSKFALEHSLTGLEFACGIPGTVGGAVFMNAGAYGGEINDVIVKAYHIDLSDYSLGEFSKEELSLSYRHSAYSDGGYLIFSALFKLEKGKREEIKAKMDDFLKRRNDKQPLDFPSAGSTFKRPEGYFAGALIEQCGLKGYTVGGAQVSEKHAGFVINAGGATSEDIIKVIRHVQSVVKEQTGVSLETEVKIIED